jgi:regulator of replication initiation timing
MNYDENSLEQEFQLYSAILDIETTLNELNQLMPADIVTTIRGLSAGIDSIKKLAELAKKSQNVELREGILDLREQLLSAKDDILDVKQELSAYKEENIALKNEIAQLKQQLENPQTTKPQLVTKDGLYFLVKEDKTNDGPFCTGCYDKDKKTIRLSKMPQIMKELGSYKCPVCNATYR